MFEGDPNSQDCNSYITNPLEKNGSYYNGFFSIPFEDSYKLILASSNNTNYGKRGINVIQFSIKFMDKNARSRFFVRVSDSENVYLKENISSIFLQSITQTNTYEVFSGDNVSLYFGRSIRKIIIPNWNAIMGFQPDYNVKPYLTSRKVVSHMQFTSPLMSIETGFDITTVLNSLGLLGGAWSLAAVAYKLLFGDDAIQPFGLVQKYGYFYKKTQKKLTKFLSTFPLIQIPDPSNNIDENRVELLERKINNLELFLRDYVVEVQQLDKIYNNIKNAND
ncbi:8835_t:CDS:2 [Cetraspora pellucida]|uniref:8835_t:CDS:1 n=1 Tax=Cetraspora pellucida TaxID=1433469 RepID=A0ACA9K063_9GLOM|nr:8835_t:CDS:2 [Cetraspora pellucida]